MTIDANRRNKLFACIGLLTAAVIWGSSYAVLKNSIDDVHFMYIMAIRFTIAGALSAIIFLPRRKLPTRKELGVGLILAVVLFAGYCFQTYGLMLTTAGKNAFLTDSYIVYIPFLHWALTKRAPNRYVWTGVVLAMAGAALLMLDGDMSLNLGDVLTLGCGLCFAVYYIIVDRMAKKYDAIRITVVQFSGSAVLCWLGALTVGGPLPAGGIPTELWGSIIYLALFCTMSAFLLQSVCQKYTAPTTASLLLSFEAVAGVIFSIILTGEQLNLKMVVGCVLILLAVIISETELRFLRRGAKSSAEHS